jgi:hypothetical protein
MRKLGSTSKSICAMAVLAALTALGPVAGASAHGGEFERFNPCPATNPQVAKCLLSQTTGGVTTIGNLALPLVNPVTIQGGFTRENEESVSKFVAPATGPVISSAPQSFPGGLKAALPPGPGLINTAIGRLVAGSSNSLYATLELAGPASGIEVNLNNLGGEEGVGLKLPVKLRLENPLLGSSCRIGSDTAPIVFSLTTGRTSPPPPNRSIVGSTGAGDFLEEGRIIKLTGGSLVDNSWSAPRAEHCGGALASLIDPIINRQLGLPAASGRNAVVIRHTSYVASALAVRTSP